MQRRTLLQGLAATAGLGSLTGCNNLPGATAGAGPVTAIGTPSRARVLVVGGGYGGATLAKYVRLLSQQRIDVTLVEPSRQFVSCPVSNLVLGGQRVMADISRDYDALGRVHGVRLVHDMVATVEPEARRVRLASGGVIGYDKLVLSPGVDLMWAAVQGLREANASGQILQAWKAGPETVALRRQLEAMPDGGVFAISIPEAPYRCPPGPYERACTVAAYFKQAKPRAKVLVLDANADVTSKAGLFKKAWAELYPGMVEYRAQHKCTAVDAANRTLKFELQEDVKADVLNVLPPMRAGALAVSTGLATSNGRWCPVKFLNFESTVAPGVHVIGDSIQTAAGMPKSGHMANAHAKVTAAALVAELLGLEVNPAPMLTNVCLSYVSASQAIHVASVHEYVAASQTFSVVAGSGGVSELRSEVEARHAQAWARNIWADMLG